jgi:reactive intermediate/imine deaminase
MERKIVQTDQAPAPVGPYNQAIAATGSMLFVSGQIPLDPQTGQLVGGDDIVAQTEQAIANLKAILAAGGATLDNVVKTSVFPQRYERLCHHERHLCQAFWRRERPGSGLCGSGATAQRRARRD